MFQLNMYENFGKCIQSRKIEIYGYLQAISMIRFVKSSVAAIKVMFCWLLCLYWMFSLAIFVYMVMQSTGFICTLCNLIVDKLSCLGVNKKLTLVCLIMHLSYGCQKQYCLRYEWEVFGLINDYTNKVMFRKKKLKFDLFRYVPFNTISRLHNDLYFALHS